MLIFEFLNAMVATFMEYFGELTPNSVGEGFDAVFSSSC